MAMRLSDFMARSIPRDLFLEDTLGNGLKFAWFLRLISSMACLNGFPLISPLLDDRSLCLDGGGRRKDEENEEGKERRKEGKEKDVRRKK